MERRKDSKHNTHWHKKIITKIILIKIRKASEHFWLARCPPLRPPLQRRKLVKTKFSMQVFIQGLGSLKRQKSQTWKDGNRKYLWCFYMFSFVYFYLFFIIFFFLAGGSSIKDTRTSLTSLTTAINNDRKNFHLMLTRRVQARELTFCWGS